MLLMKTFSLLFLIGVDAQSHGGLPFYYAPYNHACTTGLYSTLGCGFINVFGYPIVYVDLTTGSKALYDSAVSTGEPLLFKIDDEPDMMTGKTGNCHQNDGGALFKAFIQEYYSDCLSAPQTKQFGVGDFDGTRYKLPCAMIDDYEVRDGVKMLVGSFATVSEKAAHVSYMTKETAMLTYEPNPCEKLINKNTYVNYKTRDIEANKATFQGFAANPLAAALLQSPQFNLTLDQATLVLSGFGNPVLLTDFYIAQNEVLYDICHTPSSTGEFPSMVTGPQVAELVRNNATLIAKHSDWTAIFNGVDAFAKVEFGASVGAQTAAAIAGGCPMTQYGMETFMAQSNLITSTGHPGYLCYGDYHGKARSYQQMYGIRGFAQAIYEGERFQGCVKTTCYQNGTKSTILPGYTPKHWPAYSHSPGYNLMVEEALDVWSVQDATSRLTCSQSKDFYRTKGCCPTA